jgi:hypothetical protein
MYQSSVLSLLFTYHFSSSLAITVHPFHSCSHGSSLALIIKILVSCISYSVPSRVSLALPSPYFFVFPLVYLVMVFMIIISLTFSLPLTLSSWSSS